MKHAGVIDQQGFAGAEADRKGGGCLERLDELTEGRRGSSVRHPRREVDPVGAVTVRAEDRIGACVIRKDHVGADRQGAELVAFSLRKRGQGRLRVLEQAVAALGRLADAFPADPARPRMVRVQRHLLVGRQGRLGVGSRGDLRRLDDRA